MGVSKDTARSEADILSTPLPGERIRQFYERSKQYWAGTAYEHSGSRGKALRREGFRESVVITIATHRHHTDCEQNWPLQSTRNTSPCSRRSRGSSVKRNWMRHSQRPASDLAVWAPARADIGDDTGECVAMSKASGSMYIRVQYKGMVLPYAALSSYIRVLYSYGTCGVCGDCAFATFPFALGSRLFLTRHALVLLICR